MVSFTTVGYGDVVVEHSWRILSGFVSVNGLLAFGVFTAVLIEIIRGTVRPLHSKAVNSACEPLLSKWRHISLICTLVAL
jgi:hypothetical protein